MNAYDHNTRERLRAIADDSDSDMATIEALLAYWDAIVAARSLRISAERVD